MIITIIANDDDSGRDKGRIMSAFVLDKMESDINREFGSS